MATICALTTPAADLFAVCDKGPWVRRNTRLRFGFSGAQFYTVNYQALQLDAPFTHVHDGAELPPPPQEFPDGIEAVRIHSCPIQPGAGSLALLPGVIRYAPSQYRHFYIDLTGSYEAYLGKFGSKSRSTLKRKIKKFFEGQGALAFREFSRPGEMAEFQRLARAVSVKTYQHKLLHAGIPEGGEFLRELTDLAGCDRIRGYVLLRGGEPVSYNYCVALGATLMLDKTGFDPDLAHLNPGTVLTCLTIQRLLEERAFRTYDFGSGDFRYKEFFSTGSVWCADVLYIKRTLRNLAVVMAHRGLDLVCERLKSGLDVLGLKDRIKKVLHQGI